MSTKRRWLFCFVLPVLFHDVLKRSQKVFLEPEVGQLPFLQKLHGQLPQRVHCENCHIFIGITANLHRLKHNMTPTFKHIINHFVKNKCGFSETKCSFSKTCHWKTRHFSLQRRKKKFLKIDFPTWCDYFEDLILHKPNPVCSYSVRSWVSVRDVSLNTKMPESFSGSNLRLSVSHTVKQKVVEEENSAVQFNFSFLGRGR